MADVKYLVIPGHIHSKYDGDLHYISSQQLIQLYDVSPEECRVVGLFGQPEQLRGINLEDYYVLHPKYDGDYSLPTKKGYKNG